MDCSLPGSSVHGILQAIVLEWIAISFSSESSRPRDWTQVSRIVDRRFTVWATREYWSGLQFPSPGDLPKPGIKPRFPRSQADESLFPIDMSMWAVHSSLYAQPFRAEFGTAESLGFVISRWPDKKACALSPYRRILWASASASEKWT